jgi:hypothetical protein
VAVLAAWRCTAPSLSRAVKDTDARGRCERPLHPRPAGGSFAEPIKENHRRCARADAVQVETVPIDEIGAPTGWWRIAPRCLRNRLGGAADRKEQQDKEGRVEEPSA